MKTEKTIKLGLLYNAFDPSQIEYHELVYRPRTKLKTYLRDLPNDCEWKIGLNGNPVTLEEHGNKVLKATDSLQLVVVPRGGGAKNILRMVAMVAVAVAAFYFFGPQGAAGTFSLLGMSAGASAALAMAATVMAGGLLINALLPPTVPKMDSDDSTSYGYDGAKNTAKQGVPLPVVYGEYRVAGNYVDLFTENVGEDQYLYGRTVLSDGEITEVTDPIMNDQTIDHFSNVEWGFQAGTASQTVNPYFNRSITQVTKGVELVYGSSPTVHTTTEEINKFQVNLAFPQGIVHFSTKKGEKKQHESVVLVEYKLHTDTTWTTLTSDAAAAATPSSVIWNRFGGGSAGSNPANYPPGAFIFSDKRAKAIRKTIESPALPEGIYDIRVSKVNANVDEDHDYDQTVLVDIGEVITQQIPMRRIANAWYRIKMSEQLNGVPNITWKVKGVKVNKYDINGNVTVREWSDNPAWIVLDMLIGPERGFTDMYNIDFPAFVEWATWCEDQGLKFNGIFDTTSTLWDACVSVLKIGHAAFTRIGTKLSLAIDKPSQPVMLFTAGNIFKDSFQINYLPMTDRANEFELSYFDRDDLNVQKAIRIVDPDANARGDIPRAVGYQMPGIDNFEQAEKEAWYQLYNNRYIRRTVSFDAPVESIGLSIGDVALIQHDIVNWGTSGRLAGGSTNSTIKLDKTVEMESGNDYSILVIQDNVNRATGTITNVSGNVLTVESLSSTSINTDNCKRIVQGGFDREIIALNVSGSTAYVTYTGEDASFVLGPVTFVDTDVIEEKDVVFNSAETDTVSVSGGFSFTPAQYANYMFGIKEIVRKPYRLKAMSGTGFDQRKLTFVEYNEAIYNPPETLTPFPPTSEPKTVLHVRDLAFANDKFATYDNSLINGTISWQSGHIKKYGGADVYIAVNHDPENESDPSFTFYQTVFNANECHIATQSDNTVLVKVISFNDSLTRANGATAPILNLSVASPASEVGAPTNLDITQISYIATALVQLTWDAPTGLSTSEASRIRYRVQVQPDGETIWDEYGITDQQLIRVGDLVVGTHLFRVRSEIDNAVSEWVYDGFTTFTTEDTLQNGDGDSIPPGTPTGLAATSAISDLGAKLNMSWVSPGDDDIGGYVIAVKEGTGTFIEYMTTLTSHTLDGLRRNQGYTFKVRAYDTSGNYGAFSAEFTVTTTQDTTPPAVPTALSATASFQNIYLKWTNPADSDLAGVEVWENTTNNSGTATKIVTVNALPSQAGGYTRSGLSSGSQRYYWLKAVDTSGNVSAFTAALNATTVSVSETDFTPTASGIAPVIIASSLPVTGNYEGRVVSYNGKLYRYTSGAWTSSVAATDITGQITGTQITDNAITSPKIAANAITAKQLTLVDFENLAINGNMASQNLDGWSRLINSGGSIISCDGPVTTWPSPYGLRLFRASGNATELSIVNGKTSFDNTANVDGITVAPNDELYFEAIIWTENSSVYAGADMVMRDTTGALANMTPTALTNSTISVSRIQATGQNIKMTGSFKNNTSSFAKAYLRLNHNSLSVQNTNVYFWNVIIRRRNTAELIVDGTITAGKIAADTITAAQIAAGAIGASEVAAGAITASKLAISGENLFPDPQCQDINWWLGPGQGSLTNNGYLNPANPTNSYAVGWGLDTNFLGGSNTVGGSKGMWSLWSGDGSSGPLFTSTGTAQVVCPSIMCKLNTTYEIKVGCWNASNKILYVKVQFFDLTGTFISTADILSWNAADTGTPLRSAKFTTPTNAVSMRMYFEVQPGVAFSGAIRVGNISIREAASGTMIVDGSITTSHMTANTINGDRITAGTLNADKIQSSTTLPASLTIGNTGYSLTTATSAINNDASLATLNPVFNGWAGVLPDSYYYWDNHGTHTKVAGETQANAYRGTSVANFNSGIMQSNNPPWVLKPNSWIVIEADIKLNAGTLTSAGVLIVGVGTDGPSLNFSLDKDTSGNVNGVGTVGQTYRFRKMAWTGAAGNTGNVMYLMNHWDGFGSLAGTNDITWYRVGWRYASASEIDPGWQINTNGNVTKIDPGKILISGGTTLANWRNGGDNTKIEGGSIATNTITANKLTVGNRSISTIGIDFNWDGANLTWTSGYIFVNSDSNTPTAYAIGAGWSGWLSGWTYIYWNKGAGGLNASADWGAILADPNNIIVCSWYGGYNFNVTWGGTIINGNKITTGSIAADKLSVGQLSAITANVGLLRTASSGARLEIESNQIRGYYSNGNLAFRMGVW